MKTKLEALKNDFWTRLNELVEDIEYLGLEVDEANREYIVASIYDGDEGEDATYEIILGGTENTIIIKEIKCIHTEG